MTTTDTPRTDAARERYYDGKTSDWVHYTICRMIEQELAASKAEVERLKKELDAWDYGTRAEREQKRAEKAEEEVERLRSILQNLTDAVTKRLSDDFQPEAARQLWEAFKVASETLDKR
jgi:hypothetical protein